MCYIDRVGDMVLATDKRYSATSYLQQRVLAQIVSLNVAVLL
jgi:hypothetical protein